MTAKRDGATLAIIGAIIAGLSFAASYVFATKVELEQSTRRIESDVAELSGEVKVVKSEITTIRDMQKEDRRSQRVIDQNLRELMKQRFRMNPITVDDLKEE